MLSGRVPFLKALRRVDVEGDRILVLAAHPSSGEVAGAVSFASVRSLIKEAKAIAEKQGLVAP